MVLSSISPRIRFIVDTFLIPIPSTMSSSSGRLTGISTRPPTLVGKDGEESTSPYLVRAKTARRLVSAPPIPNDIRGILESYANPRDSRTLRVTSLVYRSDTLNPFLGDHCLLIAVIDL